MKNSQYIIVVRRSVLRIARRRKCLEGNLLRNILSDDDNGGAE